jgi:N-acetylglutamate synthase-like GNAT family acetyltransferase
MMVRDFNNLLQMIDSKILILDLVVSGFEESVYTVSEEDSSITLCANLASPVVQRNAMVTFQTIAVPNSAIRKQIISQFLNLCNNNVTHFSGK